jgi:hypothetical protein
VTPQSLAERRADWVKFVSVWDKIVAFLADPATRDEGVAIMAAKAGVDAATYAEFLPGTKLLTLAAAPKAPVQPGQPGQPQVQPQVPGQPQPQPANSPLRQPRPRVVPPPAPTLPGLPQPGAVPQANPPGLPATQGQQRPERRGN